MDEVSAMVAKLHWSYVTYKGFGVDKECQAATEALDRLFSALDNVDSSQV